MFYPNVSYTCGHKIDPHDRPPPNELPTTNRQPVHMSHGNTLYHVIHIISITTYTHTGPRKPISSHGEQLLAPHLLYGISNNVTDVNWSTSPNATPRHIHTRCLSTSVSLNIRHLYSEHNSHTGSAAFALHASQNYGSLEHEDTVTTIMHRNATIITLYNFIRIIAAVRQTNTGNWRRQPFSVCLFQCLYKFNNCLCRTSCSIGPIREYTVLPQTSILIAYI